MNTYMFGETLKHGQTIIQSRKVGDNKHLVLCHSDGSWITALADNTGKLTRISFFPSLLAAVTRSNERQERATTYSTYS